MIGGMKETQDCIDFCAKHNIIPTTQVSLIKKKIKFSPYLRKFMRESVANSYMTNGLLSHLNFLIYE
jgi:hypothetical protein